jgi:hypothetical protein
VIRSALWLAMVAPCTLAADVSTVSGAHNVNAPTSLRVPAFTAYLQPNSETVRVSSRSGVTGWNDRAIHVVWFGRFTQAGKLDCAVQLRCLPGAEYMLRLTVAGQAREASARGAETNMTVNFQEFVIPEPGYQRLDLEFLKPPGEPGLALDSLLLSGPAVAGAHFNLKPRRNAASVHLFYPAPDITNVDTFYCEVTAVDDPIWTFCMACGWHRGYFGMQVNSEQERRIIFSVWDSGNEAIDRGKVAGENRVQLVAKGEDVYSGDFGNEGTGGHSHLKYLWKTGARQRFVVTAKPTDATHTVYSGFYWHPDKKEWFLISSWNAPQEGGYLRGLHSFSENFGHNGDLRRKALYGNQWIRTSDGEWTELTTARFSHDETGKADRFDRFMGIEGGQFFLSHGGFVEGFTKYHQEFTRLRSGEGAPELKLPIAR